MFNIRTKSRGVVYWASPVVLHQIVKEEMVVCKTTWEDKFPCQILIRNIPIIVPNSSVNLSWIGHKGEE